jgi:hypothetical protein
MSHLPGVSDDLLATFARSIRTAPHLVTREVRLDYADGYTATVSVEVTRGVRGYALLAAITSAIAAAETANRLPRGWTRWSLVPERVESL